MSPNDFRLNGQSSSMPLNKLIEMEQSAFDDPLQTIWENCIFSLCGFTDFHRKTYCVVVTSTHEQRAAWLDDVRAIVDENFPG